MYHITKDTQYKSCNWSVEWSSKWIIINLQDIYDKVIDTMHFYGGVLSIDHPLPHKTKQNKRKPTVEIIKWDTVFKASCSYY